MRRGDHGFQSLELAILFPMILVLLAFVLVTQRSASARTRVHAAARQAARIASTEADFAMQQARATEIVNEMISPDRGCLGGPTTSVEPATFGGVTGVRVRVTCEADVSGFGLGSWQATATADEPLDQLR